MTIEGKTKAGTSACYGKSVLQKPKTLVENGAMERRSLKVACIVWIRTYSELAFRVHYLL